MSQRRWFRKWLIGAGLAVSASVSVAQDVQPAGGLRIGRFLPGALCPTVPCPSHAVPTVPCPTPAVPAMPSTPAPSKSSPATPPSMPTTPVTPPSTTDLSGVLSGPSGSGFESSLAPSAGTRSNASIAPNLMGDILGARSVSLSTSRILTATFPGAYNPANPNSALAQPGNLRLAFSPLPGQRGDTISGGPYSQLSGISSFNQELLGGQAQLDPTQTATAQAVIQAAISGRGLTAAQVAALPPEIRAQLPQLQSAVNSEINRATKGITFQNVRVGPVSGFVQGNDLIYTTTLTGEQTVALPGSSSTVGRIKMAEDTSPMPRDRWIFNYDHFDNVPFTLDGLQVNRFQFGLEKTFLDGRASFEFRLPFAGTLASTTTQGQEVTDLELGNLRMALKYLWYSSDTLHFSTGTAVTLPTANDITVNGFNPDIGIVSLYRFKNESVQVEPFAAILYTPNDRLFSQFMASVNFDVSGGELTWNRDVFGGSGSSRVWDLPLLALDYQIGYWLFRSEFNTIRGIAPFLELHYNYLIAQDLLQRELQDELLDEGLTVRTFANHELNLTAGVTTQIGNNMTLTLGGAAPLLKSPNRLFDAQFGIRLNYFFGRTARERSMANYVSGF